MKKDYIRRYHSETAGQGAEAGARSAAKGQIIAKEAMIWVVGDSTVSPFNDTYYLPREGYGEEIAGFFHARVCNLAVSGASSKDFTGMTQYKTLMEGTDTVPALGNADTTGKFLIIGFGHNDQKTEDARFTDPNGDYRTPGNFANSLYVNYVKPALDQGVTPVLCTPVARLTTENTVESYRSVSGHITEDVVVGGKTYPGGDYAQAIRDLCAALGSRVILADLTKATIEKNVSLGEDASALHAYTGAKPAEDEVTLIPTGPDKTHTNSYGARMSAWLLAEQVKGTALGRYRKNAAQPTKAAFYADAVNPDYKPCIYRVPTETAMANALLPSYTDAWGNVWYASIFGDVDGAANISTDFFTAVPTDRGLTLSVSGNKGKIAADSDAFLFCYTRLPAGTDFTISAVATVNDITANDQVSFGLMARDDLYVDTYNASAMGDYVAAGIRNQGAYIGFGRKSGTLYPTAPNAENPAKAGDVIPLSIVSTNDGYTLTYGEFVRSAGFDYALTAVDSDHVYAGFYVTRNCSVTFTNLCLTLERDGRHGQ